jgi:hypothetical protein
MTVGLARRLYSLKPLRQPLAAALAAERQNRYDLLNLLGRNQRAPMAWMTQLPTWLANVFRAKLIGRTAKVPAEVGNTMKVSADGCIGAVAALQLLKHELT